MNALKVTLIAAMVLTTTNVFAAQLGPTIEMNDSIRNRPVNSHARNEWEYLGDVRIVNPHNNTYFMGNLYIMTISNRIVYKVSTSDGDFVVYKCSNMAGYNAMIEINKSKNISSCYLNVPFW